MKIHSLTILSFVLVLISAGTQAQASQTGAEQFPIDYTRYLSDSEMLDISRRMAEADIKRRLKSGAVTSAHPETFNPLKYKEIFSQGIKKSS